MAMNVMERLEAINADQLRAEFKMKQEYPYKQMKKNDHPVNRYVKNHLIAQRRTWDELARRLGCTVVALRNRCCDPMRLSVHDLLVLADELNISPLELFIRAWIADDQLTWRS